MKVFFEIVAMIIYNEMIKFDDFSKGRYRFLGLTYSEKVRVTRMRDNLFLLVVRNYFVKFQNLN